jgi:hypothetical protein
MLKKITQDVPAKLIGEFAGKYIILSDGTIARRLKPTVIDGNNWFNMKVDNKTITRRSQRAIMTALTTEDEANV